MDPKMDKLVRRTTIASTIVVSYVLLTADYGPQPNALDPIKNAILSTEQSVKKFFFGPRKESEDGETKKSPSSTAEKHP
ncbi:hypothetical protein Leryth_022468 [Lithospermum erythrorhizon]|nr:hypothetical protein Leryth_022468 [Lithospermum erythrorhizon]